jgi:hypothetical protein
MPVASFTEALDNLYTTTWYNMRGTAADNVFNMVALWSWMKANGRFKDVTGGRFIIEPLEYAENDGVGFIGRGSTVPMNDREFLTDAQWDWHYLQAPLVRFGTDDHKNRGKNMIMNYVQSKLSNAQNSLISTLETTLFAGAGAVGGAFNGLQLLVADDPTTSTTVGGINQQTYTWWRNRTLSGASFSNAGTGFANLRTLFNNCMNNRAMDRPDILISGQTPYELYEDMLFDKLQIYDKKMTDLGFEHMVFKQTPWVWSPSCANTRIYMLNTRFIWFVTDPGLYFDMTEWKAIPNQVNDRAAQIVSACSFVTNRRRVHGVLHSIS